MFLTGNPEQKKNIKGEIKTDTHTKRKIIKVTSKAWEYMKTYSVIASSIKLSVLIACLIMFRSGIRIISSSGFPEATVYETYTFSSVFLLVGCLGLLMFVTLPGYAGITGALYVYSLYLNPSVIIFRVATYLTIFFMIAEIIEPIVEYYSKRMGGLKWRLTR